MREQQRTCKAKRMTIQLYHTIYQPQYHHRHCSQVRDIDMEAILILYHHITYSYTYIYLLTEQEP